MPSIPPLWDGYDERSEQDLLDLLERKVDATLDPEQPQDEAATRDFARAIASHERLKSEQGEQQHSSLYARASEVAEQDVGSWRPR